MYKVDLLPQAMDLIRKFEEFFYCKLLKMKFLNPLKRIKQRIIWILPALLVVISAEVKAIVVIPFTNGAICTSTFPSNYQTVSFSIREGAIKTTKGFTKGQSSKTLILGFNGSGFEFKAGAGTVTATGTEITIHSYTITTSTITVTISTSANNAEINTISFNNIEVRATAAGSATVVRSGGTLLIENKTNRPGVNKHFGALSISTPMSYTSSTAVQTITSSVFAGSTNNQILGLQVVVSGTCGSISVTSFNITDASQNPSINITSAKIYYTGTSNAFSTATLFGSRNNPTVPSTSFFITGSQTLTTAGTYYFWLTYDIAAPLTAINGNTIDAKFTSVDVGSVPRTPTVTDPAGSRTISNNIYYSRQAGLWNNTTNVWSTSSGGPACGCAPTLGNGLVYINHAINANVNSTVDVVTVQNGGSLINSSGIALSITTLLSTSGNGTFTISNPWTLTNSDVTLTGTGTSGSSVALTIGGDLTIGSTNTLQMTTASGTLFTLNGNLTVNGTLSLSGNNATLNNIAGAVLAGTGTISGTGTMTIGVSKTVSSSSNLIINPIVALSAGVTILNQGTVRANSDITGANATTSVWTNDTNSTLTMGGTTASLLSTGLLNASAAGNSVVYTGSGNQSAKGTVYNNVSFINAGVKTLGAATTVNGILTIDGSAQLAAGTITLSVDGQWINNSSNTSPFSASGAGTVDFTGIDCTITGTGTTTFNRLNISGSLLAHPTAGKLIVNSNWNNDGDFDANASDITFGGTTTLTGSSITEFYTVIVNSGQSLTFSNGDEIDIDNNFTVNGTFTPNNSLVVFGGSGNTQLINGASTSITFYQFEIDNTAGIVQFSRPSTITNGFTLTDGLITTTSTNLLTLNNGVSLSGGSATSYVNGPLRHVSSVNNATKVFPIGKGSDYRPVTLVITATGNPTSNYTAELFNASAAALSYTPPYPTGVDRVSGAHYWNISQSNATGFTNCRVTLSYGANDDVTDPANLVIVKNTGTGTAWTNIGGSGSGTPSGTITSNTFTGTFATFTFGNKGSNGLPIELADFKAVINSGVVDLSWVTKSELNNSYFTVEKSKDGKTFEKVIDIEGAGNSKVELSYSTTDEHPYAGKSYYRLKQTDFDNAFEYSDLVSVSFISDYDFKAYPNPVTGSDLKVRINGKLNDEVSFVLKDINGNSVYSNVIILQHESDLILIENVDQLTPGIYILTSSNAEKVDHQRIVVQ